MCPSKPAEFINGWEYEGDMELPVPGCGKTSVKVFRKGPLFVMVGLEEDRWHLSISHKDRYPVWDEITEARYSLLPNNITFAQLLPPKQEYVNLHPNTFHLWEIRDPLIMGRY
jgi:hypothetical protein